MFSSSTRKLFAASCMAACGMVFMADKVSAQEVVAEYAWRIDNAVTPLTGDQVNQCAQDFEKWWTIAEGARCDYIIPSTLYTGIGTMSNITVDLVTDSLIRLRYDVRTQAKTKNINTDLMMKLVKIK